jgi:HlyD family secretion protein
MEKAIGVTMKRLIRWLVILGIIFGGLYAASAPIGRYLKERSRVQWREAEVTKGQVVAVVNSTGTVNPVRSVKIGCFVSGPIESIFVDFNSEVKKGDLLARIDPRIYNAAVARDRASLANQRATVDQIKAQLQQAINDENRSKALRAENKDFISDTEMDQFRFKRQALDAQLKVAESAVDQALAMLTRSEADYKYTEILAPVDGIVIDRKVDPGQTVAASFQTPELFTLGPDMRKEMRVIASVDEADIGMIRQAQSSGQPVKFTVQGYPDDIFQGKITEVRMNSTTTQNVVTYPVVVSAANPDLKLLPGMTATISFQVGQANDVLRIPNAALRFFPQREHVRPEDHKLLETGAAATPTEESSESRRSADDIAEARKRRNKRHVWVLDGELLRAIPVVTGINDSKDTEVVSGELKEGMKLVTGIVPKS